MKDNRSVLRHQLEYVQSANSCRTVFPLSRYLDDRRSLGTAKGVIHTTRPKPAPVILISNECLNKIPDMPCQREHLIRYTIAAPWLNLYSAFHYASVLGYETGWFAPVRERLRFRSIPLAAPETIEHQKKRGGHSQAAPAPAGQASDAPAAPGNNPVPDVQAAESQRPPASKPVIPHASLVKTVGAAPSRKLALADDRPPPQPAEPSEEIQTLQRAMELLRGKHDAPAALAALDDYIARFPSSVLAPEARVARIDALLLLDRSDEALRALEALPLDAHRRSTELQLIRGELRARTDCGRADADFTAVLAAVRTAALEERALYGRAACRSSQGDAGGAAADLRSYVDRFPNGAHAEWARRWLQNNH